MQTSPGDEAREPVAPVGAILSGPGETGGAVRELGRQCVGSHFAWRLFLRGDFLVMMTMHGSFVSANTSDAGV